MKVTFKYNQEQDIWCLLKYGKDVNLFPSPTKEYMSLMKEYGEEAKEEEIKIFVEKQISNNNINKEEIIKNFQNDWDEISDEFKKIAENIFGLSLSEDITAYLTINDRCPYKIKENLFFVRIKNRLLGKKTTMHELWHFYTWYKFGIIWRDKLGNKKYNDIKEALTVLLNVECRNLLPEDINDKGYPEHKELREKILGLWEETKDINKVWDSLIQSFYEKE